jgi:dienelactone hydrolase
MGLLLLLGLAWLFPQEVQDARLGPPRTLESHHPGDLSNWEERRELVRRRVLVAAGLWPAPAAVPLAAPVVDGAIAREGYTVERVRFESLPGFFVTGNLYRPEGAGPFPGVLCPHGHWTNGRFSAIPDSEAIAQLERGEEERYANARFHLQARCATLARMGCLVFHYDMLGYADSRQLSHDRGFGDVEAELWGLSWFGLQTLDSIRALDFLLSLEGVDASRLAVTGASGGGTQTFILGAVDDRPQLLFPAVMVSTGMQGGCVCENASHLRVGTGNLEFAAMAAPRTLGLTGANDWTIDLLREVYPPLRELYERSAQAGAPTGRVEAWCHESHPHNFNLTARTHLYGLLAAQFELRAPLREPELVPVEPERLSVFAAGQPRPPGGIAEVRAQLLHGAHGELDRLAALASHDLGEFRRVVGGALSTLIAERDPPPAAWRRAAQADWVRCGGEALVRGSGLTESPLHFLAAGPEPSPAELGGRVLVTNLGADPRREELEAAWRGLGLPRLRLRPLLQAAEPQRLPIDEGRHGTYVGYTWGYNRTLFAERVGDLLAVLRLAAERSEPVSLYGGGDALAATVIAALAGDAVERVALELDWDFDEVTSLEDPDLLPGALRWGGLEFYAALVAPTPLLILKRDEVPAVVRDAYAAQGVPEVVSARRDIDADELARWLAGDHER